MPWKRWFHKSIVYTSDVSLRLSADSVTQELQHSLISRDGVSWCISGVFCVAEDQGVYSKTLQSVCERCGACCAFFLVAVDDSETDARAGGRVPHVLTMIQEESSRRCMRGTEQRYPRCVALHGAIGTTVHCTIYDLRPITCRTFARSWESGTGNILCDRARAVYGLQPFSQY